VVSHETQPRFVRACAYREPMNRSEALEHRIHAQQLDRAEAKRAITDAAVFDFGVQDTGRDGASWALANRGVSVRDAAELEASPDVALTWTLRAAPHYYRRTDLPGVLIATSPLSDRDAAKRVIGADKPLKEAGISTLTGLTEVAAQMRRVVTRPMVKGEVSTQLTAHLDPPYLRYCRACKATHSWEVPFRVGALYAGLELEPGTSPPVLRRVPDWPRRPPGPAADPMAAPESLQPIRNYLRFLGPATPTDVAAFLDSPVAEVKAHWPKDAVEVSVDGRQGWILGEVSGIEHDRELLRLLGGFDLFLQGKDRDLIVPDTSRHKELWPILGRPGAVLSGSEVVGSWRPKTAGIGFTLRLSLWVPLSKRIRKHLETEAERLAAHRGLALASIVEE
jgi:DNA glycosylase AlkZ-like